MTASHERFIEVPFEDFEFFLETFEFLTSPYSDNDVLAEMMQRENEVWRRLKAIAKANGMDLSEDETENRNEAE